MFKAKRRFVSLLAACLTAVLALVLGFAALFAPTPITTASAAETQAYSYTFTSKQFSKNESKTLNNVKWTLAGDGDYWGYDGTKGQQFGSGSKPYKTLTLTSSTTFNNVSRIEINTSGASSINASLTVKVGGTQAGNTTKIDSAAKAYTFSSSTPLTGEVVLSYTQTSSKAIYIKSIAIYESAVQCNHEYEWVQENGKHKEVCSLCEEDKPGTSLVACDGDLQYTTLKTGANGTHQKVGTCSTCNADLSTDAEACVFESSIEGTTKTYTCDCGNSYTEEIELRTISFSYPSNVTLNGDAAISSADGEVVTLPTTTNPEGYIFLGWATASIAGSTESKPITYKSWTVNGDATLYAVYQKDVQPGGWSAVTDVAELASGDIVTFAYATKNAAIGVSSGNFFTKIDATFSADGVLQDSASLTKLTVTKNANGTFSFKTSDDVYLNLNADDNYLKTSASITNNSSWKITISGSSTTITNVAYNTRLLQYNESSPRFACYKGTLKNPTIYEFTEGELISYVTTFCEHDGEKTTETEAPSCTEKGSETTTCDLCGETLSTKELPAINHANQTTTTVPASCTTAGSTTVTCDDCGTTLSTTEIPATGHAWDEGAITTPPQAGVEGEMTFTCQNGCGETRTESIPALDTTMYTVEYVVPNGVTEIDSQQVAEGFAVTLPEAGALEGYVFVGWTTTEYGGTEQPELYPFGTEYTVNENTTLYALYTYTVGGYVLVTDVNDLAVGKEIVIVAAGFNHALSTTQNTNNRAPVAITKLGNTLEMNGDVQVITLEEGTKEGTFAFKVADGYLYAASSSGNQLKTSNKKDDNASWLITIDTKSSSAVASIKAQGANTRNLLKFNAASNSLLFSCYASGQSDVCIYMNNSETYYTTGKIATIDSASITVGEDLKVNYYVTSSIELSKLTMSFSYGEKTVDVAGQVAGNRYVFILPMPPQCMADTITAELKFGEFVLVTKGDYSIQTYAQNKLTAADSSDELKRLLSDMLYYGAAAQVYKNYNLDNLASNVDDILDVAEDVNPTQGAQIVNAERESYPAYFTGANVWFGDVNKIYIKVNTIENVTMTINGGEEFALDSTTYVIDNIMATQLMDEYTIELFYNGELMQTLTYSIGAYAYAKAETEIGDLALALYRYGVSAKAYKA